MSDIYVLIKVGEWLLNFYIIDLRVKSSVTLILKFRKIFFLTFVPYNLQSNFEKDNLFNLIIHNTYLI